MIPLTCGYLNKIQGLRLRLRIRMVHFSVHTFLDASYAMRKNGTVEANANADKILKAVAPETALLIPVVESVSSGGTFSSGGSVLKTSVSIAFAGGSVKSVPLSNCSCESGISVSMGIVVSGISVSIGTVVSSTGALEFVGGGNKTRLMTDATIRPSQVRGLQLRCDIIVLHNKLTVNDSIAGKNITIKNLRIIDHVGFISRFCQGQHLSF